MSFTDSERFYLAKRRLGRLATIGPDNGPQVQPVAYRLNLDGTMDIGNYDLTRTQRWRNIERSPLVSIVVDDRVEHRERKSGRGIEIRGRAERTEGEPTFSGAGRELIRIHPTRIVRWGLTDDELGTVGRDVE